MPQLPSETGLAREAQPADRVKTAAALDDRRPAQRIGRLD
jgi:hypothetical protein